jgi:hypothetical protein
MYIDAIVDTATAVLACIALDRERDRESASERVRKE